MSALAELDHTAPEPIILQIAQDTLDFDVQFHQGYSPCGWNKAEAQLSDYLGTKSG